MYQNLFIIQLESVPIPVCLSISPSIFYMYELLLTYCYCTKNLRNYALVCFFKGIFFVKNKRLNCWISGRIISISGIRPDIRPNRISGPILIKIKIHRQKIMSKHTQKIGKKIKILLVCPIPVIMCSLERKC